MLKPISGGFAFDPSSEHILNEQRAITKQVNDNFIQIGAVWLKPSGKTPYENDWFAKSYRDTDLQAWIDDTECRSLNVGFNLQSGWVDIDIDSGDPEFNKCIVAAMNFLKIDTRFQFGRASVGAPSHVLVQLPEEESQNFSQLKNFEPNEFRLGPNRYKVELRSMPTGIKNVNLVREAKQTVMPGSVYPSKLLENTPDISVWYHDGVSVAHSVGEVAATTSRTVTFNMLVRAIAFGTSLFLFKDKWVEGSRQIVAQKVSGWLARVVRDSNGLNNHEAISTDVFCPIDSDGIAEGMLEFICAQLGDEEPYMRIRTYYDATQKLSRNPDAKIPGWPTMSQLFGDEVVNALRTVLMPGADVSILTRMADRYLYDETDDKYVDRDRFMSLDVYTHDGTALDRRHRGDFVRIDGKPKPAFKLFEVSSIRRRIDIRDLYPNLSPGGIFRINSVGDAISDDSNEDGSVVFNTWRGWPVAVANPVNEDTLTKCHNYLDRLLNFLTRDNAAQIEWLKQWLAWTIQNPAIKQQIAPVIVGGQGVGKSFFGNTFIKALLQSLWSTASPKVLEGGFSVEPFIGKMLVFIDEAKFHSEVSTEEIKKLIRNVEVGGAEKFQSARNHRIFARIIFASNHFDLNVGQANIHDRALFYIKAYDRSHLGMSAAEFRIWANSLKPFFDEFNEFLSLRDAREHYMFMLATMPTDRHLIESTEHSSAEDQDIVASNMSWARRVAKYIIEEGRILEDSDICMPFTAGDLNKKVVEACRELGLTTVQGARVIAEFKEAGLIEPWVENGRNMTRFKYKIGTITEMYGSAISVKMEPRFQFTEADFGENDATWASPKSWKGLNSSVFRKV